MTLFTVSWMRLCVPGMGMILWGVSPLYIIQKDILYENLKKVLADGKGGRATVHLKEA